MIGMAQWRHGGAWARHGGRGAPSAPIVAVVVLAASATLALGALPAAAESGTPSGSTGMACPSFDPPSTLMLISGTPQTATLGSAFASVLQVALANGDGCPLTGAVAGVPVTFSAPSTGAGGVFSASGSSTVT